MAGVTITVRNVDTGVESRATTNSSGAYTLSLMPGNYEIFAEYPGFQRTVRTGLRLTAGASTNLVLPMAVAGAVTEIQVTGTVESMILEASASTGTIIQEEVIAAIPTLSGNAIDTTLSVMGGVTRITSGSTVFDAANQSVAGIAANMINVSRDGITVNEVRNPTGIAAAGNINPEVVGEMRIILSPVDAELGRGAGQVQVTTRSGTNAWRGNAVWNIQNTALDAADFSVKVRGLEPNWRNVNNYTLNLAGPIIRNRTFFFFSWEQQIARDKMVQIPRVMTSCARRGIYRWLTAPQATPHDDGRPGGFLPNTITATGAYNLQTGNLRSVNDDGTPWRGNETVFDSGRGNTETPIGPTTVLFESVFGELRSDVRTALLNDQQFGVWGNAVDGCTIMDTMGYDPMNSQFLTMTSGPNGNFNAWTDAYRHAYDPTGFAHRFLHGADHAYGRVVMPPANYFRGQGDGLNSAGHQWTTMMIGQGSSNFGTGGDPDRRAITARVDHNISNNHRLSGTFNWESFYVWDAYRVWPEQYGGYHGDITRRPIGFTLNLNSTLRPTLLNEFRFGLSRSNTWVYHAADSQENSEQMRAVLRALSQNDASNPYFAGSWAQDQLLVIGLGAGDGQTQNHADANAATAFRPDVNPVFGATDNIERSHPFGTRGNIQTTWGGHDPRWSISNSMTWIKGTHNFKGGFDYRRQSSYQATVGTSAGFARGGSYPDMPVVRGGTTTATTDRRRQSLSRAGLEDRGWQNVWSGSQDLATGTATGNYAHAYNLMTFMSGSLSDTSLWFYAIPDITSPTGARWNDVRMGEVEYDYTVRNHEFSWFFKDDWRVTPDLTLNLGVRWEYYGVPHASDGRTLAVAGGSQSAWGITGVGDFYNNGRGWVVDRNFLPGAQWDGINQILPDPVIRYEFIGPDSPNPNRMAWNRDLTNFAPHVGFAWQLPWFGRGMTTLRGGYSVSYGMLGSFNDFPGQFVTVGAASINFNRTYSGLGDRFDPANTAYYMDLTDLRNILPVPPPPAVLPLSVQGNDAIFASASLALSEDLSSPYVHSVNMSLTRSVGTMFTVDLRYVGTFSRNAIANLNVNANNIFDNSLVDWIREFDIVRDGGESMYINSMIPHNTQELGRRYYSNVWGQSGSAQLRQQQAANLARGNYNTVYTTLGTANGQIPLIHGTERGMVMRSGCLPQDRGLDFINEFNATDGRVDVNRFPCSVGLPPNFRFAAPQFETSNIRHNTNSVNNYNSMQAQVTMRPTHGLNFQATYTWSRNLGSGTWTNYLGGRDYNMSGQHRSHQLRFFGAYELPFGPRGFFFRDASSAVRRIVEGWQMSWVVSMETGPPISVVAAGPGSVLWGRTWPILVRPDLWDDKQGKARMQWGERDPQTGNYRFMTGTYLDREYIHVLDRNLCNPERIQSTGTGNLFTTQCVNAAGNIVGGAPYAIALATRDSAGRLVPALYESDFRAPDGMVYRAGEPIIVFRNADASDGRNATGNYKPGRMTGQGRFGFDMSMSKRIMIVEGTSLEFRVDAQNILNHATPSFHTGSPVMESGGRYVSIDPPTMNITNVGAHPFGALNLKVGHRTFQGRVAIRF
jgi:hypothetical protein